jgi:ribosomal protein S1
VLTSPTAPIFLFAQKPLAIYVLIPSFPLDRLQEDNEELTEGAKVKAVVLDIDKQRYIIDVSLQPELVSAALPASSQPAKKTAKRKSKGGDEAEGLKVEDEVESRVELIKGSYLVVSVPSTKPGVHIGYVATKDCNTQHTDPFSKFIIHETCKAVVKEVRLPFRPSIHPPVSQT